MLFTSGLFLFAYLPTTVVLFFLIARVAGAGAAAAWLAFMSLVFYGYWAPVYVALLLFSIAMNYTGGILIYRALGTPRAKPLAAAFVVADLLLLGYFKYYNFFADTLHAAAVPVPVLNVVLPIGISFFTFTQIAYLVDTYQGKVREFRPLHYLLFVTYYPHLIAGPILHHKEMMPQFAEARNYRPHLRNLAIGAAFLLVGMFKKVIVADSISPIADRAFDAAGRGMIGPLHGWEGAIAYTLQLYFDFSGYSDMAVGLSLLIGVQLPYNFNSPYKSRSIIDFWRRWHMTLSRFLREYLYIALGGNRRGKGRRYVNLLATMVLGGLWHGAAWTFVIWGALHGLYLVVNHGWRHLRERAGGAPSPAEHAAGWAVTMLAVIVAWVFFRAHGVHEALAMLGAMAGRAPAAGDLLAGRATAFLPLALLGLAAVALPNSQQLVMDRLGPALDRSRARGIGAGLTAAGFGAALTCTGFLALIAASRIGSAFIYFNF